MPQQFLHRLGSTVLDGDRVDSPFDQLRPGLDGQISPVQSFIQSDQTIDEYGAGEKGHVGSSYLPVSPLETREFQSGIIPSLSEMRIFLIPGAVAIRAYLDDIGFQSNPEYQTAI